MKYKLVFPQSYIRRARKFLKKHPEIHGQYRKALELLELDPYHPSLRLQSLQGELSGLSSVSINISYRIVLELIIDDNEILFINIGKQAPGTTSPTGRNAFPGLKNPGKDRTI